MAIRRLEGEIPPTAPAIRAIFFQQCIVLEGLRQGFVLPE
jgi:hypothetical protein